MTRDYIVNADGSLRGLPPAEHQYGERWVKCAHCGMKRPAGKLCLWSNGSPNQVLPPPTNCYARCRDTGECNAYKIKREGYENQVQSVGF